jgi:phage-related protein
MAFKGLDVSITGSSASAQATIASVKSSLGSLERSANDTGDSMEELGDDTSDTTAKLSVLGATAGASAFSLTGLSTAGTGASASMAALSASLVGATAALVGLAAIAAPIVATLGAAAAAAAGLATAFGAVIGSGILAFGEERAAQNEQELEQINDRIAELEKLRETEEGLTEAQAKELEQLEEKADKVEETTSITGALGEALGEVKEEITPLIVEFGQNFIPLIEDALNAFPTLVENVLDALGPMTQFRDALRGFGQSAMEAIPNIVSGLVDLASRALPILGDLLETVGERGPGAFQSMIEVVQQVGDDFMQIGSAVADFLPNLVEFGVLLIETLAPAVDSLIGFLDDAIGAFNRFAKSDDASEIMRALGESAKELGPEIRDLAKSVGVVFAAIIDNLPEIIRGTTAVIDTVLDIVNPILNVVAPVLHVLIDLLGWVAGGFADWVEASEQAEQDLAADINSIRQSFGDAVAEIESAWSYLTGSGDESLYGDVTGQLAELETWLRDTFDISGAFEDLVAGVELALAALDLSPFTDLLETAAERVEDLIEEANKLPGIDIDFEAPSFGEASGGDQGPPQSGTTGRTQITGVASGGLIDRGGIARVHEGERIVPEAQVSDRGSVEASLSASDIRAALSGMAFDLAGELDVSGDVATMTDVRAELRRAGREATDRGRR